MTRLLGIFYFIIQMVIPVKLFAEADTKTLPLTFYIQPVTAVRAEGQSGSASVELGRVLPGVDQQAEALNVTIRTNTEQRYKIFHRYLSAITSSQGGQMPEGGLRFRVSGGSAGGQSAVPGWTEVPDGRAEIFNSSDSGGADAFTVNYLVSGKKTLAAGDYFGQVRLEIEQN